MHPEPQSDQPKLKDTIYEIGRALASLDPGALADLRRLSLDGDHAGAPYFWRLASRHDFGTDARLATWARIVQIMAILTDKGVADGKRSPHDPPTKENGWRGLGHALCDGGDPAWGRGETEPRPMLSELRFARLLAARDTVRADLMERAARALATKKPPGAGVNCSDLAHVLLYPDTPCHARKLARDYYARLDRTRRAEDAPNDAPATGDNR